MQRHGAAQLREATSAALTQSWPVRDSGGITVSGRLVSASADGHRSMHARVPQVCLGQCQI